MEIQLPKLGDICVTQFLNVIGIIEKVFGI